jgi:hypothetical protein
VSYYSIDAIIDNSKKAIKGMEALSARCYLCEDTGDVIRTWYEAQNAIVQTAFEQALSLLEGLPRGQLPPWLYKPLTKRAGSDCSGLHELLFEGENEDGSKFCCRVIGFEGPHDDAFTMLFAFDKETDGDQYDAPCGTALERMNHVKQNWAKSGECTIGEEG